MESADKTVKSRARKLSSVVFRRPADDVARELIGKILGTDAQGKESYCWARVVET